MNIKKRIYYAGIICVIIALGLFSRKVAFIPLWIGDALWACMIYFMVRLIFLINSVRNIAIVSLIICYGVEFSQLCHIGLLDEIRSTLIGRLILGQGFLWTDMMAYTIGVLFVATIEWVVLKRGDQK